MRALLIGYFLYRTWAYVQIRIPEPLMCFPFFHCSSATLMLWFTIYQDFAQILSFTSNLFYDDVGRSREFLIERNHKEYTEGWPANY